MSRKNENILLYLSDFIFINLAWTVYYLIRIESGWIPYSSPASFLVPLFLVYLYWLLFFLFTGLYQYWFVRSRFDEFISVLRSVSIGCFILFLVIFLDDALNNEKAFSRYLILIYWVLMIGCVGFGRILIRSFQMNLLQKGIGLRKSVIIGTGERGKELSALAGKYPQLGYKVVGFISTGNNEIDENSIGNINNLMNIIENYNVTEILIALENNDKDRLLEIISKCPHEKVNLKILPDTYEIISGMVKTNQLYGVPLIEVMPQIMSHGSLMIKRGIDLSLSFMILFFAFPVLALSALLIKLNSKGGVFYLQTRIGRNGKQFTMYKFRTMFRDAEEYGPEWAGERDPRITRVGKMLRKIYIDELPQLINVIKNDMSIVGPRPERPHFVDLLSKEIPYYYKRMSVKPGITGWAQVKHKYDSSLDDVKEKLQYDFYYIENMSLKLDFKIMINTILVVILMKGH